MDRESLRLLLAQGLSLSEIGRRFGRDPSTVGYWVRKHGLSPNGRAKHAPRGGIDRWVLEDMVARGLSMRRMARDLDVSLATVRHWMARYGLRSVAYLRPAGTGPPKPKTLERSCRRHGSTTFTLLNSGGYRCKRCNSDAVSARRRKVKRTLVEEAGGRCCVCGYRRCVAALEFHHLDPRQKSFALSRQGVTRSIAEARTEAGKCVLLCANCHAEVEALRSELRGVLRTAEA